jgi:hypothetical protein
MWRPCWRSLAAGWTWRSSPASCPSRRPTASWWRERDRMAVEGERVRVLLEIFVEEDIEARLLTWSLDLVPGATPLELPRIVGATRLTAITGLYRLALDTTREFAVHDLRLRAPDLSLDLSSGAAFIAEAGDGVTGVVLLGRGRMLFTPPIQPNVRRCASSADETPSTPSSTRRSSACDRPSSRPSSPPARCGRGRSTHRMRAGRSPYSTRTSAGPCRSTFQTSAVTAGRSSRRGATSSPKSGRAGTGC